MFGNYACLKLYTKDVHTFGVWAILKEKTSPPKTKRHNLQDFLFYFAIMASWTLGCVLYQQTLGREDDGGQLFVWNMGGQLRFFSEWVFGCNFRDLEIARRIVNCYIGVNERQICFQIHACTHLL